MTVPAVGIYPFQRKLQIHPLAMFYGTVVHFQSAIAGLKKKKELRNAQLLLSTVDQLGLEPRTSRL